MYQLLIKNSAQRELDRLPKPDRGRIDRAIQQLRENPRPHNSAKLSGVADSYRIRVGDYRVLYQIDDDRLIILVVTIAHRHQVYRGL